MEDIDFQADFVVGNSNKLQKLGLEGKISWALHGFMFPNLEIFNSENVKNKECVHTWAKGTSYTSTFWYFFCSSQFHGYGACMIIDGCMVVSPFWNLSKFEV